MSLAESYCFSELVVQMLFTKKRNFFLQSLTATVVLLSGALVPHYQHALSFLQVAHWLLGAPFVL